jgi:hypothetical protein
MADERPRQGPGLVNPPWFYRHQYAYGVVSLSMLGLSLFIQVLVIKFFGKVPWLSNDVFFTAVCLGPLLEAFRDIYCETARPAGAWNARQLLAILKASEVVFESLPEMVLQITLLSSSPNHWNSPTLLVSLAVSIITAAVLIADAESSINSIGGSRRRNIEYYGYLPTAGGRRFLILLSMMAFTGAYLMMAASSIAVTIQLFPLWTVAATLAADCGLHHVWRARRLRTSGGSSATMFAPV